jgi:hypothetical protein
MRRNFNLQPSLSAVALAKAEAFPQNSLPSFSRNFVCPFERANSPKAKT